MEVVLCYPPFCTPASPPYSITNIFSFLTNNTDKSIELLDLNILYHSLQFPEFKTYFQTFDKDYSRATYTEKSNEFIRVTKKNYSENNKRVLNNETPEHFDELLSEICKLNPQSVAFSIVYSSQVHYTIALVKALKEQGITTIVGGPCVSSQLKKCADHYLANEIELLAFIEGKKINHNQLNFETVIEYTQLPVDDYFTPELVYPYRSSNTCFYQKCTFCTHHGNAEYFEFPLKNIVASIVATKARAVFFTDDMIHKKRLLEIATLLEPLDVVWMCQLRPLRDLDQDTLTTLYASGLRHVVWGVESGSQRILNVMQKGTNVQDVKDVLRNAKNAGIINATYIMFGFPTETEEEFMETVHLLQQNSATIDLVSTSQFGLQEGAPILTQPELFSITAIKKEGRTVLEPKITYETTVGLSREQVQKLRKKYRKTIDAINEYPATMNFFREHVLCLQLKRPYEACTMSRSSSDSLSNN